ncbi:MAG: hypothetical protein ACFFEK_12195 [Candidatus Thorarchaeota archaeon]
MTIDASNALRKTPKLVAATILYGPGIDGWGFGSVCGFIYVPSSVSSVDAVSSSVSFKALIAFVVRYERVFLFNQDLFLMPDWEDLLKQAKEDVLLAVELWGHVLKETFGPRLKYAYAKGSALKQWDSLVDYVPVLSDLDMHIMLTDSGDMFPSDALGFSSSINVARQFEERFLKARPDHLHIPRAQIVHLNPTLDDPSFILPLVSEVHVMVGSPVDGKLPSDDEIKALDLKELQECAIYLQDLPRQAVDRVGLDFWTMLRRINWRVSPSPIRLLTQIHSAPLEVWKWNRTRISQELKKNGYDSLVSSYRKYYETGWELFFSGFSDYGKLREIVIHGYDVLHKCVTSI